MQDLFEYYGQILQDVIFVATLAFSIDPKQWIDDIDKNLIFLSRYANLQPQWVEQQDISRQNRLVRFTIEMIKEQYAAGSTEQPSDRTEEWL